MTIHQFAELMNKHFMDVNGGGLLDDYTMENRENGMIVFCASNDIDAEYMWSTLVGAAYFYNEMGGSEFRVTRIKEVVFIYDGDDCTDFSSSDDDKEE